MGLGLSRCYWAFGLDLEVPIRAFVPLMLAFLIKNDLFITPVLNYSLKTQNLYSTQSQLKVIYIIFLFNKYKVM